LAALAAAVTVLVLAPVFLVATEAPWLRWVAAMALFWWLPGALLVAHWRLSKLDTPSATVLAAGLGLCWMMLLALLVHWVPGPVALWMLLLAYEVGALALLVGLFWRRPLPLQPVPARTWGWLAVLLLFACLLRLPGIGYHDFHGDEVVVLQRARHALEGADNVLARHAKGPGEIAVAMAVYGAVGTANEAMARLPFALLGVAGVMAVAVLGSRLFPPGTVGNGRLGGGVGHGQPRGADGNGQPRRAAATAGIDGEGQPRRAAPTLGLGVGAGFWAGILLAANGFALALSRIVQYQPAVLLLSVLAVLCAWEFAQRGEGRWLALAILFSGFGMLLHYEFALMAPVLLLLAWQGWRHSPHKRRVAQLASAAAVVAVLIVAITYLPGVLDPRFARTQRYLGSRLGSIGAFNLPIFVELGTFYNSIYFFGGLILLVVMGLILGWRSARRRTWLLVLWFVPFLVLHLFIMQFPGTHFYLFMPSWSLLAALPLAALSRWATTEGRPYGWLRWGAIGLVAAWLALSVGYLYVAFFRQAPEYFANYGQERLPVYWTPWGEDVPQRPRYGFPIHEGWKALGTLAAWECLEGTFTSNEGSQSVRYWYLPTLQRVEPEAMPDLVFRASHLQALYREYQEGFLDGYQQVGEVRVRGEPRIELWAREPLAAPYVTYDSEEFEGVFDDLVPRLTAGLLRQAQGGAEPPLQIGGVRLGEEMVLESASLDRTVVSAGDALLVDLVWVPQRSLDQNLKLFVHVAGEDDRPVAQWDGFPCLNTARTSQWPVGERASDHVLIRIPEEVQPGDYAVLVGLYDGASGERLGGQAIRVGLITVR
jgi:4-amino-4-deoxy-L-arabinose transferase-like glycosyltransferase